MAIIEHAQNRNHKQSATEAFQQDKLQKARHVRRALDFGHSPQDLPPLPSPPQQPGKGYPQANEDP